MGQRTTGSTRFRLPWLVAAGLAVVALVAFGVPLVSLLYVGILLLCPLLMVGMHGGHGHRRDHDAHARDADRSASSSADASGSKESRHPLEGGRT